MSTQQEIAKAEELLLLATELGALRFGDFVLASGQRSTYYFDGRLLTLSPAGANLIAGLLLPALRRYGAQAVGGPAVGAVPLVTEIAMLSGLDGGNPLPGFFVRKEAKAYGLGNAIEGPIQNKNPIAIVDDTCSTAGSLYMAINAVEEAGYKVAVLASILDRDQGGRDRLASDGYTFHTIFRANDAGEVTLAENPG